jgi:polygalacturonase
MLFRPSLRKTVGASAMVLFLSCLAARAAGGDSNSPDADVAWSRVPEILARIQSPQFPDRTFDITEFGAKSDGKTDCTKAFASAITACHEAGGGKVNVPAGDFLTGAIHLKSNVNLHLEKGATIKFSTDPNDFLPVVFSRDVAEMMNYSPFIYAFEQTNVAITGEGTIDGQASKSVWPEWPKKAKADAERLTQMGDAEIPVKDRVMGKGHFIRPCFVEPVRCRNVLIEGIRVVDSPMWELHPLYCTNVTIRGVSISSHGKNNDGCDPDSCTDVLIEDCTFDTGDDCIAIKSGRDHDGRRVNIPSQNIVIRNCVFKRGHGGVTLGSETAGGLRNVFAENCRFDSPDLDQALRFKTNPSRGGFIEDVHIRNCEIQTARYGIYITMRYASSGAKEGDAFPKVSNIEIRNCSFDTLTKSPVVIEGWSPEHPISDVTIANCDFKNAAQPASITNAVGIHLINNRGLKQE